MRVAWVVDDSCADAHRSEHLKWGGAAVESEERREREREREIETGGLVHQWYRPNRASLRLYRSK